MPVKHTIPYNNGMFFITFTCHNWLPLIDKVAGYDIIYKWCDHLKGKGHFVNGYVIMPNHVHALSVLNIILKRVGIYPVTNFMEMEDVNLL